MHVSKVAGDSARLNANRSISAAAMLPVLIFPLAVAALYYGLHAGRDIEPFRQYPALLHWLGFYLALQVAALTHVAAMTLASCLGGTVPLAKVSLGFGWPLVTIRIAGVPVHIKGPLPGGYVQFLPCDDRALSAIKWRLAGACLAGPAALLVPCVVSGGLRIFPAIPAFWQSVWQGAIDSAYGVKLLGQLAAPVHGLPATPLLLAVFFWTAALNLFPVPPLAGQAYANFMPQRWAERLTRAGFLLMLITIGAWCRIAAIAAVA
jgi:hypothetical protein